jgi:hypothetical protein
MHRRKALAIAATAAVTVGAGSLAAAANLGILTHADEDAVGNLNATNVSQLATSTTGASRVEYVYDEPTGDASAVVEDSLADAPDDATPARDDTVTSVASEAGSSNEMDPLEGVPPWAGDPASAGAWFWPGASFTTPAPDAATRPGVTPLSNGSSTPRQPSATPAPSPSYAPRPGIAPPAPVVTILPPYLEPEDPYEDPYDEVDELDEVDEVDDPDQPDQPDETDDPYDD